MQKLVNTIKLMAKTGLFFAHADGEYSDKEKKYVTDFVSGIENIGDLDSNLKQELLDTVNHTYTFEEIIDETHALLDGFDENEQNARKKSLKAFVNQVISIDGERKKVEQENYIRWRQSI